MNKIAHHVETIARAIADIEADDGVCTEFAHTLAEDGSCAVGLFEEGAVKLVRIVATGMSRLDAVLVAQVLNAARGLRQDRGGIA